MKLGANQLKVYMVLQDFSSKKLVGFHNEVPYLTDDIKKAFVLPNKRIAREIRDKYPLENWILVFAKLKTTKKQQWD